jgi:hypothetical protein
MSTDPEYPPQSFLNADGQFDGFDVEGGRAIAERLGVDIQFVTPGWEVITAGKWSGRWDCLDRLDDADRGAGPGPPTGNQFIAMLKDSALVSVMGAWEIMFLARPHGRAEFRYMEMLITAALIYWALSATFEVIQSRIERRFGKGVSA